MVLDHLWVFRCKRIYLLETIESKLVFSNFCGTSLKIFFTRNYPFLSGKNIFVHRNITQDSFGHTQFIIRSSKMAGVLGKISLPDDQPLEELLAKHTVPELQQELKRRGLKRSGVKAKLIQRLKEVLYSLR